MSRFGRALRLVRAGGPTPPEPQVPAYYSPTFAAGDVPDEVWARRSPLRGVALDLDDQLPLLEEVARLGAELAQTGFRFANAFYEHGDAEVAYGMVRWARPRRVVELGSGFSSHALAAACEANRRDGLEVRYEVFDPFPRDDAPLPERGIDAIHSVRAEDVDEQVFTGLGAGDVLFVDTTHVVKIGGDVNRLVLDVLPVLAPGVLVHFHDIWLPFEYHRDLTAILGFNWSEQYLLQAFLSGNGAYEVLIALAALVRVHRERVVPLFAGWDGSTFPSAFWIRRQGG